MTRVRCGAVATSLLVWALACGTGGRAPTTAPVARFPLVVDANLCAMALSPGGDLLVAFASGTAPDAPLTIRRYAADGSLVWDLRWPGFPRRLMHARGIAAAPDGGAFVAFDAPWCDSTGGAVCEYPLRAGDALIPHGAVVRLTPQGSVAWWYGIDQGQIFTRIPLAAAQDGRVAFVAGSRATVLSPSGAPIFEAADSYAAPAFDASGALYVSRKIPSGSELVRLDASGDVAWSVPTIAWETEATITAAPHGQVLVAGGTVRNMLEWHDARDGALRAQVALPLEGLGAPLAVATAPDGSACVAGGDVGSGAMAVVSYGPDAAPRTSRTIAAASALAWPSPDVQALAVGSDGRVLLGGSFQAPFLFGPAEPPAGQTGGFVVELGPDLDSALGTSLAPDPVPVPPRFGAAVEGSVSVAGLPDGGAYVVAARPRIEGEPPGTVEIARYGAAGDVLWRRSYTDLVTQEISAVTATPDGGLLVAVVQGYCGQHPTDACSTPLLDLGGGAVSTDFVAKLGADGSLEWQVPLAALAIAAAPDGRIALAMTVQGTQVLDAAGQTLWSVGDAGPAVFGPDGSLYEGDGFSSCSGARSLAGWDTAGRLLWRVPSNTCGALAFAGDGVVGLEPAASGVRAIAYDPATGVERWRGGSLDATGSLDRRPLGLQEGAASVAVLAGPGGETVVLGSRTAGCGALSVTVLRADGTVSRSRDLGASPVCLGAPVLVDASMAGSDAIVVARLVAESQFGAGLVNPAATVRVRDSAYVISVVP